MGKLIVNFVVWMTAVVTFCGLELPVEIEADDALYGLDYGNLQ